MLQRLFVIGHLFCERVLRYPCIYADQRLPNGEVRRDSAVSGRHVKRTARRKLPFVATPSLFPNGIGANSPTDLWGFVIHKVLDGYLGNAVGFIYQRYVLREVYAIYHDYVLDASRPSS